MGAAVVQASVPRWCGLLASRSRIPRLYGLHSAYLLCRVSSVECRVRFFSSFPCHTSRRCRDRQQTQTDGPQHSTLLSVVCVCVFPIRQSLGAQLHLAIEKKSEVEHQAGGMGGAESSSVDGIPPTRERAPTHQHFVTISHTSCGVLSGFSGRIP